MNPSICIGFHSENMSTSICWMFRFTFDPQPQALKDFSRRQPFHVGPADHGLLLEFTSVLIAYGGTSEQQLVTRKNERTEAGTHYNEKAKGRHQMDRRVCRMFVSQLNLPTISRSLPSAIKQQQWYKKFIQNGP